uniref:Uncharacterized protein n=1 Tax=Branchiostoma floridae TaxID=7739 RepID=C3Z8U5_BRAFL|eukprot:XP_002595033.1 hypothetical protein BRAFLDRAFT_99654 [Branchiostoma floridae]
MASNMDTKHGDKGETEHDKTTAAISEADSGRGLSVADVSSPEGDDQRRVGTNQDLDEIEPRMPIQTDTLQDSQAAVGKEPYDRELQLQEGERDELYDGDSPETTSKRIVQPSEQGEDAFAKWQSAYGRHDNVFQLLIVDPVSGKWRKLQLRDVCVNRVDQKGSGHVSVDVTGLEVRDANKTNGNIVAGNEQRDVLRDLQDLSLSESVVLSYRRGSDVSPHLLQEVKERGAGKSPHVQEFFSFIAKHLASFGEVEDCYILPLRNGLLISQSELTVRSIQGTKLTVAQNPATLWKLEELLEKVAKTPTTQTPTVDELLPILQEISEGLPKTSDTVDSQDSLEDGVPSPPNFQFTPEGSAQIETLEGLKKQIEELTEENEKYRKDLSDAEKKLKEEENRVKELHESRNQLSNMVRATEEDLENLEGVLKLARASEKKWKSEVERLESENQKKQEMLDKAEQEKQELKAEISKLQDRAKQNEGHRVED